MKTCLRELVTRGAFRIRFMGTDDQNYNDRRIYVVKQNRYECLSMSAQERQPTISAWCWPSLCGAGSWRKVGVEDAEVLRLSSNRKSGREFSRFCRDMDRGRLGSIITSPTAILLKIGLYNSTIIVDSAIFTMCQAAI